MAPVKANRWTVAAFMAAVLGAFVAAFAPTYTGCTTTTTTTGSTVEVCGHATAFAVNGAWVLVVVSVPVLVTLLPVLIRRRPVRVVSSVLLWAGCIVAMFSVGMFFVPAAILMTIAASRRPSAAPPPMPPIPVG
jgi:hypothetical protein